MATMGIGELARQTGLSVTTVRYYADLGLVPPAGRTTAGYRLFDAESAVRLELIRTLRELGIDLGTIRRVLAQEVGVAEVAALHADALDTQIRTLRLRRAVLRAVARRGGTALEVERMHRMAHQSAEERRRIIHEFLDGVFGGLDGDPEIERMMRSSTPELPQDPAPAQVEAWLELAELVRDPDFRRRIRGMAEHSASERAAGRPPLDGDAGRAIGAKARAAIEAGIAPDSAAAEPVLREIVALAGLERSRLLAALRSGTDARAERYWRLLATINGWPAWPDQVPAFEWVIAGLEAEERRGA